MRFHAEGPDIPDVLLERSDAGQVVFFCGAGVSKSSGIPGFTDLTEHVIDSFHPTEDSEIMREFQPWRDDKTGKKMPLDQIFNLLHLEYGRDEVNALVTKHLQIPEGNVQVGYHHSLVRRISISKKGVPQIITTNFDLLFEFGVDRDLPVFVYPSLPDLKSGATVEGITYLHGRLSDLDADKHQYVLSRDDFGSAYLSNTWVTKFIRNLLDRYTVVLIGYQAEDPLFKYLLGGLKRDGQSDRTRIYAFEKGAPEEIEAKWSNLGVTAIAYLDHCNLWRTVEAWADRRDNVRDWCQKIITNTEYVPKSLHPYQRGQVVHVLKSALGAKLLAHAEHPTHPEWVCLFNDDLLSWRHGDKNPSDSHSLGGIVPNAYTEVPQRLLHLFRWIGNNISSPVIAWWVIEQNGLHPRLLELIERRLGVNVELSEKARRVWRLIIDHHKDPRNFKWDGGCSVLKQRINNEGWSPSVLREFGSVAAPKLVIKPPYSVAGIQPPTADWPDIELNPLDLFDVRFLGLRKLVTTVPNEVLPQVCGLLEDAMKAASGMLADIGASYFVTPTCYPGREVEGRHFHYGTDDFFNFFLELFERLVQRSPDIARGHFQTWPNDDKYFFGKLRLFVLSKEELFGFKDVGQHLLKLSQDLFWDRSVARELIFLLVDRWSEFPESLRHDLGERLLKGPDKNSHWSDDEFPSMRDEFIASYARYLEIKGCELAGDQADRLSAIIATIGNWSDGRATSMFTESGSHSGWIKTDETPDVLFGLPVNEIIPRAEEEGLQSDFGGLIEKRPFRGLVKAHPSRALSALSVAARQNYYPQDFWEDMIKELPDDITPGLKREFLQNLNHLPDNVIMELRHTVCDWLEENITKLIEFDDKLAWAIFDGVVDKFVSGGEIATKSGMGETSIRDEAIPQSCRNYEHAKNRPLEMCAKALLHVVLDEKPEQASPIPDHIKRRFYRLFESRGEGCDYAVSIVFCELNQLIYVDPEWVKNRLVPMLEFDHSAAEPAWNGFLSASKNWDFWSPLAVLPKRLLLEAMHWVESQTWNCKIMEAEVLIQWLWRMYILKRDEEDGLTKEEMRRVLREMSDDSRSRFIWCLGKVGQENDKGWETLVTPFLKEVWPRELIYRTASSVESWISMLDDAGTSFPVVYRAVKPFLKPVEIDPSMFCLFTPEKDENESVAAQFPEETLGLLDAVISKDLSHYPHELSEILKLIVDISPKLEADRRYLKLIHLARRS